MNIISLVISLLGAVITWWKPGAGLALAAQAYLIRSALIDNTNSASINTSTTTTESDPILSIVLPLIVFLIIGIKSFKNWQYFRLHYLDILFVVLGIWLLFSSMETPSMYKGLEIAVRYFVLGISFYFFARLIPLADLHKIRENLSASIITIWFLAIIIGGLAFPSIIYQNSFSSRLSVGNANPIAFSLLISLGIVTNIYWLLSNKNLSLFVKVFFFFSTSFLTLLLIGSQTRSMIVAIIILLPIMIAQSLKGKDKNIANYLVGLICAVLGLIIIFLLISLWKPEMIELWIHRLALIFEPEQDLSISQRLGGYDFALQLFLNNYLIGVGTGNYGNHSSFTYTHNLFLEIAAEQGILGSLILITIIFSILGILIFARKYANHNQNINLFSAWILLNLIVANFSFTLWQHKNLFLSVGLLISCLTWTQSKNKQPTNVILSHSND